MAEVPVKSNKDEINRVYVILGTSHDIQWTGGAPSPSVRKVIDGLKSTIRGLIVKYEVKLIAEETLGPNAKSTCLATSLKRLASVRKRIDAINPAYRQARTPKSACAAPTT